MRWKSNTGLWIGFVLVAAAGCSDGVGSSTTIDADADDTALDGNDAVDDADDTADQGVELAACESLYAAAVAEEMGCGCDTVFAQGAGCALPSAQRPNTTLCLDSETPNACARRLYDEAPTAVGFAPGPNDPRGFVARYLPRCADGGDDCPGEEVRCYDGTRPAIYAQRAHAQDHTPIESGVWVITMGGEGGPCGGEVSTANEQNCWLPYTGGGAFRGSLTTKSPWDGPPSAQTSRGGLQQDREELNGRDNPFHGTNRVLFERCGEWASEGEEVVNPTNEGLASHPGPTTIYHHGFRTTLTLFNALTTEAGRDFGGAAGSLEPDGDADDPGDLPDLSEATLILLTGSSDAGKWLIYAADRLADELATMAPGAEVRVVFDSILTPFVETEFQMQYDYDEARDSNVNGVNDIFDHITENPDGRRVPHAEDDDPPYGASTYQDGGRARLSFDLTRVATDESCLAAHADDPGPCYDNGHVALNHVETPYMIVMDHTDATARNSGWSGTANEWPDAPYAARINQQGLDMARFVADYAGDDDPTVAGQGYQPGLWMANRGWHVHMLLANRLEGQLVRCNDADEVVETLDLVTALDRWMRGETGIDAVLGYERGDGTTWYPNARCGN